MLRWRLELSPSDWNRVSDVCALLLAGSGLYLFATSGALRTVGGPRAFTLLLQRLPLIVALLVACQAYSTAGRVPASAFFWALRRRAARGEATPGALDLGYPYVVLCVLSASAANVRTPTFYAGLCALAAWALWRERSRRFHPLAWAGLLTAAVALGWAGQALLHGAQEKLEQVVFEYIFSLVRRADTDPFLLHIYAALAADASRNEIIANDILRAIESGRCPLLLTGRTQHLQYFEAKLAGVAKHVFVLKGGMGKKQRRETAEALASVPENESRYRAPALEKGLDVLELLKGRQV